MDEISGSNHNLSTGVRCKMYLKHRVDENHRNCKVNSKFFVQLKMETDEKKFDGNLPFDLCR